MNSFLAAGLLLAAGVASAGAALIYDGFDYAVAADLAAQTNPGGNPWDAMATGDTIQVSSGSLSTTGLMASTGHSITYGGLGQTDRISVGSAITGGVVYYSFLMKVTDISTLGTGGGFIAGFNTTTGDSGTAPTQIGARLLTRLSGTGYNLGMERNSGTGTNFVWDSTVRNVNDTVFVVGSYEFVAGAANDLCTLWINPDPSSFGAALAPTPSVTITAANAGADLTQVASFLFRQGNATAIPGALTADELRVDTTWAGVTPVPEPGGPALAALALGAACAGRRRPRGRA